MRVDATEGPIHTGAKETGITLPVRAGLRGAGRTSSDKTPGHRAAGPGAAWSPRAQDTG